MEQEAVPMSDKLHHLYSIVVELVAMESGKPPATLGRAIHALVLRWLQLGNPDVAERIHASQMSPLSLSGLMGHRRSKQTQPGDSFLFRIGLLDEGLIQPLLLGLTKWENQPVVLGKFPFVWTRSLMMPESHPLADCSAYETLVNAPSLGGNIQLNFNSPTSFKQQQGIQNFPLPDLVFGSLHRRWNSFAPPGLHFPEIDWQGWVSAYELKTHALRLEGGAEIGAQGWIRYRFSDAEQARIAAILARFAFFAGVGRKTTMGMGQTELIVKEKPKPKKKQR